VQSELCWVSAAGGDAAAGTAYAAQFCSFLCAQVCSLTVHHVVAAQHAAYDGSDLSDASGAAYAWLSNCVLKTPPLNVTASYTRKSLM
jgi:hypothetical protein